MDYFFFLKDFVDATVQEERNTGRSISTDVAIEKFQKHLIEQLSDAQFSVLLVTTGFIPDIYPNDSSEETLYSKLVEIVVCEWARRMGFESECIKQKASFEDVVIFIDGKAIVCDAKSFRLGRSQAAPNVKDFLKLEDIRKWLSRHKGKLGGLVTYPDTHEWSSSSDVYQYCTTKDVPTIMLPYKYLALLLNFKDEYRTENLRNLWSYNRLFPDVLQKNIPGGNKKGYWTTINEEIVSITGIPKEKMDDFLYYANAKIEECIHANLQILKKKRDDIVSQIKQEVSSLNETELRHHLIHVRIKTETSQINNMISRIQNFRL